jgi:hypothetical protein
MKIVLPNERPISWNQWYAGEHWMVRKKKADEIHELMKYTLMQAEYRPQVKIFPGKVDVRVTGYFKDRPLDPDNIVSKLYIDGLKGLLIEDDTHRHIRSVTTSSQMDKQNPRVEIDIEPAV